MNRINQSCKPIGRFGRRFRQRGIAMPLIVIGLVAMLAFVGLAIDSSHAFVNKTRMQNSADAAALAAAKVYDQTADTVPSNAAANSVFGLNTNGNGNFEIDSAYDSGDITVAIQWSQTLNPFVSSGIGPYVRVSASGFNITTGFLSVIGVSEISVPATAVAGPSPAIAYACNIAPMLACANDPDDDYYGFVQDDLIVLKPSPGDHGDVGPGNYKLLRLGCESGGGGGNCVRDAMAGSYAACASTSEDVTTEPGVTAGPTSQGFNTRFGVYDGPINPDDYPPDLVVHQPPVASRLDTRLEWNPVDPANPQDVICWGPCDNKDPEGGPTTEVVVTKGSELVDGMGESFDYDDYVSRVTAGTHKFKAPVGEAWRRLLAMPVADCSGDQSGLATLTVDGFACYFMLQQIGGGEDKNIFGQFVDTCPAGGVPGMNPGPGKGPYIIQLYKDPDSGHS
jgi:Flp pilus assembly protein TadG